MACCKDLIEKLEYTCIRGSVETEVTSVEMDSRKMKPGCMFICIAGANFDGHSKAAEAAQKKAAVLVVEKEVELPKDADITVIQVESTRYAMAFISAAWFGHPADTLKVIGVTGTKGKTTTTYLVKSILDHAGYKTGLVGTIETIIDKEHIPAHNTTPESYVLQETFRKMLDAGCQVCVMEVSSQGLMLHRTQGFTFELGIFTNLEPDHIGPNEHKDFEDYARCKGLLFKQCRVGIINCDDTHWKQVLKGYTCKLETYGFNEEASLRADHLTLVKKPGELGVAFDVKGLMEFHAEVPAPGRFSIYNALCAIAICRHFNVSVEDIQKALLKAHVKGRIEMVKVSDEFTLMIDYAHNAMALESLLTTLREYEPHRLVCLFGCGGTAPNCVAMRWGRSAGSWRTLRSSLPTIRGLRIPLPS